MFEKLKSMWCALLHRIKSRKKEYGGEPADNGIQPYTDIKNINWLAIAVKKLTNLACNEATFEIVSDSTATDEIKLLASDTEEHRFEITAGMLAEGDYYIFPYIDDSGELKHSYLEASRVRITAAEGDKVIQAYAVIDYVQPDSKSDKCCFLLRKHSLDKSGNLTVSYQTVDESGNSTANEYWPELDGVVNTFAGAGNIGFGRYKSPVSSRGYSSVYGVPLNFGCSDVEKKINETVKQIEDEFKNAKSILFVDPRNILEDKETKEYKLASNVIPIRRNPNDTGSQIDIFSPQIRGSEHWEKLNKYLETYEQQIGVSKGIFTDNSSTATATATAVKRANSDTISLLNAIHTALDKGNQMTFEADGVYLNIRRDLWEYRSDYFDPFEDPAEQWQRLLEAKEAGAVTAERLIKWLYPDMTDEEAAEELIKVSEASSSAEQSAIERALMM